MELTIILTGILPKQTQNVLYLKMQKSLKGLLWCLPIMKNIVLLPVFAMHMVVFGILFKWLKTRKQETLLFTKQNHCPAGRLIAWDKKTGKPYEPAFDPAIGIIEDPEIKVSGPIWVKGVFV